ncbi:MAG: hypothetical protein OK422_05675 [Thaumarchaeota archaeon]|nr:hypothetical protein [Nitrososphaerota archaeon]
MTLIGAVTGAGNTISPSSLVAGFQLAFVGATVLSGTSFIMATRIQRPRFVPQADAGLSSKPFTIPDGGSTFEGSSADES